MINSIQLSFYFPSFKIVFNITVKWEGWIVLAMLTSCMATLPLVIRNSTKDAQISKSYILNLN